MKIKKRILAALWAAKNPDRLTMLKHELKTDARELNSNGGIPLSACRAKWYFNRYLFDLPIE